MISDGFLDYLPDLYGRYSGVSGLRQAVLAAAYANIAQKTRRKDLQLGATSFYQDSLRRVKHNISNPHVATSDVNMTAVILLGLYEVSAACFLVRGKSLPSVISGNY